LEHVRVRTEAGGDVFKLGVGFQIIAQLQSALGGREMVRVRMLQGFYAAR